MAGDLFIMSIAAADIENLERVGGRVLTSVQHADRTSGGDWATLDLQLTPGRPQNRRHLPPHCYIEFDPRTFREDLAFTMVRILKGVSRPLGVVKNRADLAGWDGLNDLARCVTFAAAVRNGPVVLEFYKVGLWSVKDYFRDFTMVDEH